MKNKTEAYLLSIEMMRSTERNDRRGVSNAYKGLIKLMDPIKLIKSDGDLDRDEKEFDMFSQSCTQAVKDDVGNKIRGIALIDARKKFQELKRKYGE